MGTAITMVVFSEEDLTPTEVHGIMKDYERWQGVEVVLTDCTPWNPEDESED